MLSKELLKTDLNLLISMQVLLDERNVSRAAERLFITQPAMSKTLGRLREVFDDPLFTRSSHGMLPTPRALAIGEELGDILMDIGKLVSGADFDPSSYQGELTLALSEYIGVSLLPPLMKRLSERAPGLTLKTITRVEQQLQRLTLGELDLAIHIKQRDYGEDFICESMGASPPVLLTRRDHPLTGTSYTWEELLQYPIIRLYISDEEDLELAQHTDNIARRLEQERQRGWLEISHLLTALEVLRSTDYVMPAPLFLLGNPSVAQGIQGLRMPPDVNYRIEYLVVRHQRTANSPVHNWLWQQITEVLEELRNA